jgi:hypothetical protein
VCPQALLDALLQYTDAGVATSADAVVSFDEVAVLAPRGRYQVEMHASFLKLVGQVRSQPFCQSWLVGNSSADKLTFPWLVPGWFEANSGCVADQRGRQRPL